MRLLVSVAGPGEARAALAGGADVIDAKDPRRGALGAVRPGVLRAVREAVGSGCPLSAALGDVAAADEAKVLHRAAAAAALGAAFVKVGFSGISNATSARRLASAVRRHAGDQTQVVVVAYADWQQAESLDPAAIVALAAETGSAGVLLDTAVKSRGLFTVLAPAMVAEWVAAAHAVGLFAALAGSLEGKDFSMAHALDADIVGIRGAACLGGRTGRVSASRVAALSALVGAAPFAAHAALV
jgi:(5-formylfuran-3-yl)methyl phosphate synthase